MAKAAIVILAGNESHADYGRLANGLEAAKEFAETEGDELELIFDGAGTQWIPELEDEESDYHELYQAVRDDAAVCDYLNQERVPPFTAGVNPTLHGTNHVRRLFRGILSDFLLSFEE